MSPFKALRATYYRTLQRAIVVRSWSQFGEAFGCDRPSVALVGNAGYLNEIEQGDHIDRHDIVIRMNNFRVAGHEKTVGQKTDVFLTNFYHDVDFSRGEVAGARWIISSVPNNFHKAKPALTDHYHGVYITRRMRELGRKEVFVPSVDMFVEYVIRLGKYPTTGAMGIQLILDHLIDVCGPVYITGFSFFKGTQHYFGPSKVKPHYHDPERERAMVIARLAGPIERGRIKTDSIMKSYLLSADTL
jgi:hypothetical protein